MHLTHSKLFSAPMPVYDPTCSNLARPKDQLHWPLFCFVPCVKELPVFSFDSVHLSPPSKISPVLSVHLTLTLRCLSVVFLNLLISPQEVGPHQPILLLPSASEAVSLARGTNRLCVCESADWSYAISPSDHWSRRYTSEARVSAC